MNAPNSPKTPSAVDAALSMLSRRALTCAELRQRLAAKGHDEAAVESAMAAMQRYGYLNDAAVADAVRQAALRSGRGPLWIRNKLYRRGVESQLSKVAATVDTAAALQAARALLDKRFGSLAEPKERQRAFRFLCNRGFPPHCARAAVGAAPETE